MRGGNLRVRDLFVRAAATVLAVGGMHQAASAALDWDIVVDQTSTTTRSQRMDSGPPRPESSAARTVARNSRSA